MFLLFIAGNEDSSEPSGGVAIPPPANIYNTGGSNTDEYGIEVGKGGEEDEYGGGGGQESSEYGGGGEAEFKAPPPPPPPAGEMAPPPKPSVTQLIKNPSKVVMCKVGAETELFSQIRFTPGQRAFLLISGHKSKTVEY
jgi:hypothetical protein